MNDTFKVGGVRAATATIILLTAISYAISFEQMVLVAEKAGIIHPLTFGYGLLLEGFVSVATYTAFVCGLTWLGLYPWLVAIAAFSFSAWINYSAGDVPSGLVRVVAVIAVPVGVHMVAVLRHAYDRREKAAKAAAAVPVEPQVIEVPVEVERIVEVPQEIGPDVDVSTIKEPMALAYKIMATHHDHAATRTYNKGRFEEWLNSKAANSDNLVEMIPGMVS